MRAVVLALVLLAGCDRGSSAGKKKVDPRLAAEQTEFDRERRPDVVIATIGLKPGDVVADVGAGTGLLTIHIARAVSPGGHVVATDVDAAVLDLLASRMADAGLSEVVEREVVAPEDPGLEPGAFDVILLAQVDHYFQDPVSWLKKAIPALRPGGRIVITNRVHHRTDGLEAAQKAGLRKVRESTDIPGQYVAVFQL